MNTSLGFITQGRSLNVSSENVQRSGEYGRVFQSPRRGDSRSLGRGSCGPFGLRRTSRNDFFPLARISRPISSLCDPLIAYLARARSARERHRGNDMSARSGRHHRVAESAASSADSSVPFPRAGEAGRGRRAGPPALSCYGRDLTTSSEEDGDGRQQVPSRESRRGRVRTMHSLGMGKTLLKHITVSLCWSTEKKKKKKGGPGRHGRGGDHVESCRPRRRS